jgi:hypothetical protein
VEAATRAPNEATILYRDAIERDQSISMPFPLPGAAVAGRIVERRRTEALQREEGKWETALHYRKRMRASGLYNPRSPSTTSPARTAV